MIPLVCHQCGQPAPTSVCPRCRATQPGQLIVAVPPEHVHAAGLSLQNSGVGGLPAGPVLVAQLQRGEVAVGRGLPEPRLLQVQRFLSANGVGSRIAFGSDVGPAAKPSSGLSSRVRVGAVVVLVAAIGAFLLKPSVRQEVPPPSSVIELPVEAPAEAATKRSARRTAVPRKPARRSPLPATDSKYGVSLQGPRFRDGSVWIPFQVFIPTSAHLPESLTITVHFDTGSVDVGPRSPRLVEHALVGAKIYNYVLVVHPPNSGSQPEFVQVQADQYVSRRERIM